jgi:hypothetical protein
MNPNTGEILDMSEVEALGRRSKRHFQPITQQEAQALIPLPQSKRAKAVLDLRRDERKRARKAAKKARRDGR